MLRCGNQPESNDAYHIGIAPGRFGLDEHIAAPTRKEFALIPPALLKRGYAESDVAKIAGGNFMRVFREVGASG